MLEKRSSARNSYMTDDNVRVVTLEGEDIPANMMKVNIIDISEDGIGLQTDLELRPGQYIEFVEEDYPDTAWRKGVIMWSMALRPGFRIGVKYV